MLALNLLALASWVAHAEPDPSRHDAIDAILRRPWSGDSLSPSGFTDRPPVRAAQQLALDVWPGGELRGTLVTALLINDRKYSATFEVRGTVDYAGEALRLTLTPVDPGYLPTTFGWCPLEGTVRVGNVQDRPGEFTIQGTLAKTDGTYNVCIGRGELTLVARGPATFPDDQRRGAAALVACRDTWANVRALLAAHDSGGGDEEVEVARAALRRSLGVAQEAATGLPDTSLAARLAALHLSGRSDSPLKMPDAPSAPSRVALGESFKRCRDFVGHAERFVGVYAGSLSRAHFYALEAFNAYPPVEVGFAEAMHPGLAPPSSPGFGPRSALVTAHEAAVDAAHRFWGRIAAAGIGTGSPSERVAAVRTALGEARGPLLAAKEAPSTAVERSLAAYEASARARVQSIAREIDAIVARVGEAAPAADEAEAILAEVAAADGRIRSGEAAYGEALKAARGEVGR